ncbi:cytochrome c oxidase accessory protein CcoG [Sphingobacterium sp. UT-1RO-CII-1]|uniref:cytochrome c oxidase accessory protein CcoG n=1 Tax=Sphingobacterium sp. UT-1RO-CII-1 TaxID=2995225 RepID=UPI00227CC300|nr:cytochrome c oxidase accessory protein CcoG [Sphingobacterium sp. UT-1RO-CII-1]MCY4780705.1 cytochrome c oxidase accessory protein CcoG [Sphingobacterium sp. UT-1RO-CII-1]
MGTVALNNETKPKPLKEKRKWIYAKKPKGTFYNYRQWVGYTLLLFLFGAPFIKIDGNPFLMFNILERKFSIFGQMFYPQDLHIFVFGMLIVMVCVVLFTTVFGRIWCGWTCPQTVFMELIFRRIEYLIEGDWIQQKKLNEGPDSDKRAWKKLLKHSIFYAISFLISNIFLAYIIGVDELYKIVSDPLDAHIVGFIAILLFSFVFYGVFAHVREYVCTTICPYGRLQGVLMDDQSVTVAYDVNRGEPRGKLRKGETQVLGDCIDCKLCVQVCPTGIDIRDGLQMECVSCTACIDACDEVMVKINKPKRLIGFYSMGQIVDNKNFKKKNVRAIAYSIVLLGLMSVFVAMIFSRTDIGGRLLRAKGSTYQLHEDGTVSNLYTLELINKANKEMNFVIEPTDDRMKIKMVNDIHMLKREGHATLSFFMLTDRVNVEKYKQDVKVNVVSDGKVIETLKTTFIAPPDSK